MKIVTCLLILSATAATPMLARAGIIPSVQVAGSLSDNSGSALTVTPIAIPNGNGQLDYEYRVDLLPLGQGT